MSGIVSRPTDADFSPLTREQLRGLRELAGVEPNPRQLETEPHDWRFHSIPEIDRTVWPWREVTP